MIELSEELTLPNDVMFAVMTARPELILDREFSPAEQLQLLQLIRVLLKKTYEFGMDVEDYKLKFEEIKDSTQAIIDSLNNIHSLVYGVNSIIEE